MVYRPSCGTSASRTPVLCNDTSQIPQRGSRVQDIVDVTRLMHAMKRAGPEVDDADRDTVAVVRRDLEAAAACSAAIGGRAIKSQRHTVLPDCDLTLLVDLVARGLARRGGDDQLQELIGHDFGIGGVAAPCRRRSRSSAIYVPASAELELILSVGTGKPSGVPRPVVNNRTVAPAATSAVDEMPSLPGASSSVSPGLVVRSP